MEKIYEICGDFEVNGVSIREEDIQKNNYVYLNDMRPKKSYPR
jgi:hypothetical protein